jgi:hypothetical protein
MTLNDLFASDIGQSQRYATEDEAGTPSALDEMFKGRTAILKTKLDVFAWEISQRLRIREHNVDAILENQERARSMLAVITRQVNYSMRSHQDKTRFYDLHFELERQRRCEDVECWQDIVEVMKDFLNVWEALEHAKARAVFLAG